MSSPRADPPHPSGAARIGGAWRGLQASQRRVVLAAVLLLASMFLPWYSRNYAASSAKGQLQTASDATSAIGTFTFVEAAIFLVAVGVALLMFARGERRPFHLPGGDGFIVSAAGGWATFLVFYRFVDQPAGGTSKSIAYDYGLHWGIFFGLLAALFLTYAGNALRTAHLTEPPLPGDVAPTTAPPAVPQQQDDAPTAPRSRDRRARVPRDQAPTVVRPRTSAGRAAADQLSFDEPPEAPEPDPEPPTRRAPRPLFDDPGAFEDEPPEFPRR